MIKDIDFKKLTELATSLEIADKRKKKFIELESLKIEDIVENKLNQQEVINILKEIGIDEKYAIKAYNQIYPSLRKIDQLNSKYNISLGKDIYLKREFEKESDVIMKAAEDLYDTVKIMHPDLKLNSHFLRKKYNNKEKFVNEVKSNIMYSYIGGFSEFEVNLSKFTPRKILPDKRKNLAYIWFKNRDQKNIFIHVHEHKVMETLGDYILRQKSRGFYGEIIRHYEFK